jgi:ribosomal-protein-alanine N-acetyltransferase
MNGKIIVETARLIIREFTATDAPFIVRLVNSEGWLKYIGDRKIRTEADALIYLQSGPLQSYAQNGFGLWMVEVKDSHEAAGMCGLIRRSYLPSPDLGFAFLPEYTGKGYALESARGTLSFAQEKGIDKLCAITMPDNKNSIRLLEKAGFVFQKEITLPPDNETLQLYVK